MGKSLVAAQSVPARPARRISEMRSVTPRRSVFIVLLAAAAAGATIHRGAGAVPPPATLTPATYEGIKSRLALSERDLAWQQVRWRDGFFEGLLEAQAADKPL